MDQNQYSVEYRANYGEKMQGQIRRWYEEHPNYGCQWQEANRERYNHYQNQWRALNREKWNEYMKDYMQKYRARKNQELS